MKKALLILTLISCTLLSQAKQYKGGEIQSKKAFHYGRFETRFYSSSISGMLSTFYLFENEGWKGTSLWQEIDIEVFGKDSADSWQSNVIYQTEGNANGERKMEEDWHKFKNKRVASWHKYAIEWTPDYIEWFVDDVSIRKFTDKEVLDLVGAKPMLLMLNHWASNIPAWSGQLDKRALPSYQFVDYVKVYDWKEGNTFKETPSFEDDFSGDLSKWNISTHTFPENLCDFDTRNVRTKKGYLVLAFTDENTAGRIAPPPYDKDAIKKD